jgi:hypothetical protein
LGGRHCERREAIQPVLLVSEQRGEEGGGIRHFLRTERVRRLDCFGARRLAMTGAALFFVKPESPSRLCRQPPLGKGAFGMQHVGWAASASRPCSCKGWVKGGGAAKAAPLFFGGNKTLIRRFAPPSPKGRLGAAAWRLVSDKARDSVDIPPVAFRRQPRPRGPRKA